MKFFTVAAAFLPALSSAHTIAQRVRVNGQDNGLTVGIRTATSNYPIQNVNDGSFACKSGYQSPVSSKVIDVKAGDKVGVNFGHIIGGAQSNPDADNPIASSHKGPTIFYMYVTSSLSSVNLLSPDTHSSTGPRWTTLHQPQHPARSGSKSSRTALTAQENGAWTA
jgi:hypothetical protein